MPAPNPGSWTKDKIPFGWDPFNALSFWEVQDSVCLWIKPDFPLTREMVLLLFFHETAFSNVNQVNGPAVGFGQMEYRNGDKIPYFMELGFSMPMALPNKVTGQKPIDYGRLAVNFKDDDFAIKTHCNWFVWMYEKKNNQSSESLLRAQTGGSPNSRLVPMIQKAAPLLKDALTSRDRRKIIDALNEGRYVLPRDKAGNVTSGDLVKMSIPFGGQFQDYWDYTLPADKAFL